LKHKQARLKQIKEAKVALEKREKALKPDKEIDEKKQISFADKCELGHNPFTGYVYVIYQ